MAGPREQQLADDYAAALDGLQDRSVANMTRTLNSSLRSVLQTLRRSYSGYVDATQADHTSFDGVQRRPYSYTIREMTARYNELRRIAGAFLPPRELQALIDAYALDLRDAIEMGGDLGVRLADELVPERDNSNVKPAPVPRATLEDAVGRTSAYIEGEVRTFRDNLVEIVTGGIAEGRGFRGIEQKVREALRGAKDPNGITQRMGLKQRAELIARSELANGYVGGMIRQSQTMGFEYGRWIAAKDELTCRLCGARHGLVFRLSALVAPAHPRCRCVISPVTNEAVESGNPDLLESPYWARSQDAMRKELAAANGWDLTRVQAEILKARQKPTPSERRRFPAMERSAEPVADPGADVGSPEAA